MGEKNQETRRESQDQKEVLILGSKSIAVLHLYQIIKTTTMKTFNRLNKRDNFIKSLFFSSGPKGWKKDFFNYPFREWVKIEEIRLWLILGMLVMILATTSCTDVIDVPVQTAQTRLVVEASIDWEKGTLGNEQLIKLRTSTAFFETTSNTAAIGATVKVTNDTNGAEFIFTDQNNGDYTTDEFIPIIDQAYTLEVNYNGETYRAQERLFPVPVIKDVFQDVVDGFDDEELEVHIIFDDPPELGNNVFFKAQKQRDLLPLLEVGYDEFINGNEVDWWIEYEEEEETDELEAFQPGDIVDIEMYAISTPYKDYLEILIEQIGGADLFDATPVSVKGNVINETNADNYAHGYFRLTEFNKTSYTFE